jgi:hypothetical protein
VSLNDSPIRDYPSSKTCPRTSNAQ